MFIEYFDIIPWGTIRDSIGANLHICDISDCYIQLSHNVSINRYLKSYVKDEFHRNVMYNGNHIKHDELYNIIISYVDHYKRMKKMKRVLNV